MFSRETNATMHVPGQSTNPIKSPYSSIWLSVIATLAICLWAANVLPIQSVQYQLTTNLAISQHRLPLLERLRTHPLETSDQLPLVIKSIQSSDGEGDSPANSEQRSVKVVVSFPLRSQAGQVESLLDEMTLPTLQTDECAELTKRARQQRWIVESTQHSLKTISLDMEREKLWQLAASLAESESGDSLASTQREAEPSGPFRFSSFSARSVPPGQENELLQNELQQFSTSESEKLEAMLLTLDRLKAKARGFLSVTGSPKLEPLVRSVPFGRLIVLCFFCCMVWLLCMAWLNPVTKILPSFQGIVPVVTKFKRSAYKPQVHQSADIKKMVQWMKRAGIPYLGAVQIHSESNLQPTKQSDLVAANEIDRSNVAPVSIDCDPNRAAALLRSIAEGSIVMWLGLFAARFMFDSAWRELVSVAPLAAISRMVLGIY